METYIQIAYLNDFIFCPLSIYFHQLYGKLSDSMYHDLPQVEGRQAHEKIEAKQYSSRKTILQGIEVYSAQYNLCGKIDIFNVDSGILTERKKKIVTIYDGYVFQLYAQYYCLTEMGYSIKKLQFYSSDDNKVYSVKLPDDDIKMKGAFEQTIADMAVFNIETYVQINAEKCGRCIYEPLCDRSLVC